MERQNEQVTVNKAFLLEALLAQEREEVCFTYLLSYYQDRLMTITRILQDALLDKPGKSGPAGTNSDPRGAG